jgi:hypothetical protein
VSLVIARLLMACPAAVPCSKVHGDLGALGQMGMALENCQVLDGGFVWLRYRWVCDRCSSRKE